MENELKPCPMCGKEARIHKKFVEHYNGKGMLFWFVRCRRDSCSTQAGMRKTKIKAVEKWNARPAPQDQKEALEALDKAMTIICKEAAACVRSDDLPSDIQEDYERKVPVWILRGFTDLHEKQRQRGIRLKQAYDILNKFRNRIKGD